MPRLASPPVKSVGILAAISTVAWIGWSAHGAADPPFKSDTATRAMLEYKESVRDAEQRVKVATERLSRKLERAADDEDAAGRLDEAARLRRTAEAFSVGGSDRLQLLLKDTRWAFAGSEKGTFELQDKGLVRWTQNGRVRPGTWVAVSNDVAIVRIVNDFVVVFDTGTQTAQMFLSTAKWASAKRLN